MKTKAELIQECKLANPVITENVNGIERQLDAIEYEVVCENWADMRLQQIALEEKQLESETKRQILLAKLGITEDEARLLLGGN